MLDHILKARSSPQGTTIGGIRAYELTCEVAFLGRRRRVYSRLVALSGARPGDQVLDVGVAQDLTWPDGSFDVVTCTLAVHAGIPALMACATPTPPCSAAWPRRPGSASRRPATCPSCAMSGPCTLSPATMPARCHNDAMVRRVVRTVLISASAIAAATLIGRRLGYKLGTSTIVRCRQGHLFTTIWIPGVKLKEVDLLVARVQRCPVGQHWSLVVPVREADLTEEERQFARDHHDVRIP